MVGLAGLAAMKKLKYNYVMEASDRLNGTKDVVRGRCCLVLQKIGRCRDALPKRKLDHQQFLFVRQAPGKKQKVGTRFAGRIHLAPAERCQEGPGTGVGVLQ